MKQFRTVVVAEASEHGCEMAPSLDGGLRCSSVSSCRASPSGVLVVRLLGRDASLDRANVLPTIDRARWPVGGRAGGRAGRHLRRSDE